ncbi:AfsR/SARP family transcriptional regulator [Streptosporangium subroseum]|uniref:AfsR/SARP family transcriptional regulator n=1 Tax=Streptosporangium subroseum TaxID=106412 RepID=UPI00308D4C8F|nr:NB-ARC domain-containing protein [Streptosporangium subroseum]
MTFLILGSLTVRNAKHETIHIQRLKHRQLLATLLLRANTPTSIEHLMESLWDGAPPPSAERNIKTYVHTLRKLLSPDDLRSTPIETQADGYLIAIEPEDLDLLTFQAHVRQGRQASRVRDLDTAYHYFEQALGLWRGEALLNSRGSRSLDDAAAHLSAEHLASLEELSEIRLGLGRYAEAASGLRAAALANPTHERLWAQLMLSLYGAGDRAAALRAYQRFRKVVAEETGLEPCQPIQDLHQRILASGSVFDLRLPAKSIHLVEAAPCDPIPHQLPRDPADFVGRGDELVQLRSLLSPPNGRLPHHVVAITGPPGSGKSTLAVRTAHLVRDRFPGGQLYANLHGATPGIRRLEPLEVLGRFLRALGVAPHTVPSDVDEAAALWRSLLDGRDVLVVLDDVVDLAQVRPLLSVPKGSTILLTSRQTFALVDNCVHVRISRMSQTEATTMLARLAGAERVARDVRATTRLVGLCGNLPLAVGIAGARLANRPQWEVADLVERLEDERRRLHELEAGDLAVSSSLAVSYDLFLGGAHPLDRTAAHALCALGVLQVPDVTSHVIGALLDVPVDMAERAMERLVDGHLAEVDETGRYRLHDLIRLFAGEQAVRQQTRAVRGATLNRALSSYVATTRLAVKLSGYRRPAPTEVDLSADPAPLTSGDEAREWLEQELANLLSAASQAMAAPEERTARLGAALALSLFWHLQRSGLPSRLLAINRQVLGVGQRLGDRNVQAYAHGYMSMALSVTGHREEAMDHVLEELALFRELSDLHGEQIALGSLGEIYLLLGRYEEAIGYAEAQRRVAKTIGYRPGEHYAATTIGAAHHKLRQFDQALKVLGEALAQTREDGNLYQETAVHEKLGDIHLDLGDPASARICYETALTCAHVAKLSIAEPYMLLGLARSSRLLGEFDQAAAYLARSVATARATGTEELKSGLAEEEAVLAAHGRPITALTGS